MAAPDDLGLVRALLYGVQFEQHLLDGVDRTLQNVVARGALGASAAEYLDCVRRMLASDAELSTALDLAVDHSEAEVREYLAEIGRRLQGS